jgi:hypothetical protein
MDFKTDRDARKLKINTRLTVTARGAPSLACSTWLDMLKCFAPRSRAENGEHCSPLRGKF